MNSQTLAKEEFDLITLSFEFVFDHIANTDNKADKKEENAFTTFITKTKNLESNLAKEILMNYDVSQMREKSKNGKSNKVNLKEIGNILDDKFNHEDAVEFKKTLIVFGYFIANSSGSFFDHKVSHDEEDSLNEVGFALGISVSDVVKSGELNNLLEKLV